MDAVTGFQEEYLVDTKHFNYLSLKFEREEGHFDYCFSKKKS